MMVAKIRGKDARVSGLIDLYFLWKSMSAMRSWSRVFRIREKVRSWSRIFLIQEKVQDLLLLWQNIGVLILIHERFPLIVWQVFEEMNLIYIHWLQSHSNVESPTAFLSVWSLMLQSQRKLLFIELDEAINHFYLYAIL